MYNVSVPANQWVRSGSFKEFLEKWKENLQGRRSEAIALGLLHEIPKLHYAEAGSPAARAGREVLIDRITFLLKVGKFSDSEPYDFNRDPVCGTAQRMLVEIWIEKALDELDEIPIVRFLGISHGALASSPRLLGKMAHAMRSRWCLPLRSDEYREALMWAMLTWGMSLFFLDPATDRRGIDVCAEIKRFFGENLMSKDDLWDYFRSHREITERDGPRVICSSDRKEAIFRASHCYWSRDHRKSR